MIVWPSTNCPTCNAKPREMCRTKDGKRCVKPHSKRPFGSLRDYTHDIRLQMEIVDG